MKRLISCLAAFAMILPLAACGASSSASYSVEKPQAAPSVTENSGAYGWNEEAEYEVDDMDADYGASEERKSDSETVYDPSHAKLVYTANLSVQVSDLIQSADVLEQMVEDVGGYISDSNVYLGGDYSSYRSASYTIRIPSKSYRAFLESVGSAEAWHVTNKSENVEDIGEIYFDTESRIRNLKSELDQLNALMAQATDMESIVSLHNAIYEIQCELDNYNTTLNHYNSLLSYSTVNVDLEQVSVFTPGEEASLFSRVTTAFRDGTESFFSWMEDVLVWFVGNLFFLILYAVIIVLIVFFWKKRKRRDPNPNKKRFHFGKKKKNPTDETPPEA